jgi:hypothetical protein
VPSGYVVISLTRACGGTGQRLTIQRSLLRSLSSLIEQAGFEEKAKALEDEFARKNKEAEDAWNRTYRTSPARRRATATVPRLMK